MAYKFHTGLIGFFFDFSGRILHFLISNEQHSEHADFFVDTSSSSSYVVYALVL